MTTAAISSIPIITRITSKLIRILGCNPGPMTLQGTNTYLLGNGRDRILIDTGDTGKSEYIKHLKMVLFEEKATINNIILTHWHHDHIGGVEDVLETLGTDNKCRIWKYSRTDASDSYSELKNVTLNTLTDGQEISVDGAAVKVIHTPGHTTDHCILMMKEDNVIFSGDCILGEGTAVFEDLYDYMKSLKLIINLNPAIIYPGHGNIITNPISKIQYYIDHRNQREEQILRILQSNPGKYYSDMDLVENVYVDVPEHLWPAAARNVKQHLKKMHKENIIIEKQDDQEITKFKYNDKQKTNENSSVSRSRL